MSSNPCIYTDYEGGTRFPTLSGTLLGVPTASDQLWKLIFTQRKGTSSALEALCDALLYKSTSTLCYYDCYNYSYIRRKASGSSRSVDSADVLRVARSERIEHHATTTAASSTQRVEVTSSDGTRIPQRIPEQITTLHADHPQHRFTYLFNTTSYTWYTKIPAKKYKQFIAHGKLNNFCHISASCLSININ